MEIEGSHDRLLKEENAFIDTGNFNSSLASEIKNNNY